MCTPFVSNQFVFGLFCFLPVSGHFPSLLGLRLFFVTDKSPHAFFKFP